MNRKEPSVTGRRCSRVARKDLLCGCSSIFRYQKPKLVLQKIKVGDVQLRECSGFESRNSHTRLHLSEDLVFEILVRLPAKSVARFRCVSSAWLTIATDPSFILAHARRAPISLLVSSILTINRNGCLFHNLLFSFSLRGSFCCKRRLDQISDSAISSLNGLVLFFRNKEHLLPSDSEYYVLNPLIGRRIDLPHLNRISQKFVRTMDLYYHRWTGEYRVLNLNKCIEGPDTCHLDAAVLSLGGASSSWRQIKAKAPLGHLFHWHRQIQVNDRFYWTCLEFSDTPIILVFDILKETFSLMELPSYSQKSTFPSFAVGSCLKYGLVDMEGILCLWCVYIDKSCAKNVMIDIWAAADGDEKWKNTYSLCLVDEWGWALKYSDKNYQLEDFCFCFREKELLFLFNGRKSYPLMDKTKVYAQYLFYWDLKSDKYWTELLSSYFELLTPSAFIYKETLITTPFNQTIITDALE